MKYELWYSEADRTGVLLYEGDYHGAKLNPPDARVVWTVEAKNYEEARARRDEFLKENTWETKDRPFSEEELRSVGLGGRNEHPSANRTQAVAHGPTHRVTMGMYLDEDGNEQSLEVPGWVGVVPHFLAANIDVTRALGQLYLERPYPNLASAPPVFTIIDLRSTDSEERMLQEFVGKLEDAETIRRLISQRLGPEMARWKILTVHWMANGPRPSRSSA